MSLHESLRELVAVRGTGVVEEAEEFRGALDDFLAEDEATLGELNLLVDAVRLGGLRRVLDVLDHGAAPDAAIREAGAALARDRGTDDPTRSCWALAALAFALGRVEEPLVRIFRADTGTMSIPETPTAPPDRALAPGFPPPEARSGQTYPLPGAEPRPRTLEDPSPPAPPVPGTAPAPAPPPAAPPQPRRSPRAGTVLLVVLAALFVGGLVAAGILLLRPSADDGPTDGASDGESEAVPKEAILVPYDPDGKGGEGSRIFQVDTGGGEAKALTEVPAAAPGDRLPALSPDRTMVAFLRGPGGEPVPYALDLETEEVERVFPEDGPCEYATRPAWSPEGDRIAVVCSEPDGDPTGIYVADVTEELPLEPEPLLDEPLVNGAPTWISQDTIVYARFGDPSESTSELWSYAVGDSAAERLSTPEQGFLSHPDWSPEADLLLFLSHPDPDDELGELWTARPDSDPEPVPGPLVEHPVWSPNGESVAFTLPAEDDSDSSVLATAPLDDLDDSTVLTSVPNGAAGVPVWASR